jgi:hypothetical protein
MSPSRVVLHVGAPKSGTTFLQRSLWNRKAELAEVGVRCVGEQPRDMFHAAIGLRGSENFWGMNPAEVRATWERLCAQAREGSHTWVMSHELLSLCTQRQADRALADLQGLDLHLVYTARDLGRQVPSEWQERVKNGSTISFGEFERGIAERMSSDQASGTFWRAQDAVHVLDRWGASIAPDHVHVVVAPERGAPPELLWERFGAAVGFDGQAITADAGTRSNQTLGSTQAELLRRVNEQLGDRVPQPHYARLVKRQFSQGTLTRQRSAPARCSPALLQQLHDFALAQNHELEERGYQVHGDLAELVPDVDGGDAIDPSSLSGEELAEAATAALADLLADRMPQKPGQGNTTAAARHTGGSRGGAARSPRSRLSAVVGRLRNRGRR